MRRSSRRPGGLSSSAKGEWAAGNRAAHAIVAPMFDRTNPRAVKALTRVEIGNLNWRNELLACPPARALDAGLFRSGTLSSAKERACSRASTIGTTYQQSDMSSALTRAGGYSENSDRPLAGRPAAPNLN